MQKSFDTFRLALKFIILSAGVIIIAGMLFSWRTMHSFEQVLRPQIDKKAEILTTSIHDLISLALSHNFPLRKLHGLEEYFDELREKNPEIRYIALRDMTGNLLCLSGTSDEELEMILSQSLFGLNSQVVSSAGRFSYYTIRLINREKEPVAAIVLGISKSVVADTFKDNLLDIITLFAVSLLIILEVIIFLTDKTITAPLASIHRLLQQGLNGAYTHRLKSRTSRETAEFTRLFNSLIIKVNSAYATVHKVLGATHKKIKEFEGQFTFAEKYHAKVYMHRSMISVRLPLFLVIFAESLSLSFFPLYVNSLYTPIAGISREVVIGLPISIFMLFWALSLPYAGAWSDRKGRHIPFLVGACITTLGLILTAYSRSILDLLAWRSITAVGYGIVYITCQGYITDTTTPQNRTQGMAMFLSGFFAGSLSGSAIGGILADRIGFQATFLTSAVLALFAALFAIKQLRLDDTLQAKEKKKSFQLQHFRLILANKKLLGLVAFSAIPAKICLTGFLYFAAPMFLTSMGSSQSSIGRALMFYGLAMVLFSPIVAKAADRIKDRRLFIIICGLLSGIGLMMIKWFHTPLGVFSGIIILGCAHSIGISSQLTFVTEICEKEREKIGLGTVIAFFRLLERIGNILGPILTGLLISIFGYSEGIFFIGLITFIGAMLFISMSRIQSTPVPDSVLA